MISFNIKSQKASSSPLGLSTPSEKPILSFSDLLRGMGKKEEPKVVQNGALVLALASDVKENISAKDNTNVKTAPKSDTFFSLLKNEDTIALESKEILELNPKLAVALDVKELKVLVKDAKEYLKTQIIQSDGYQKSQIQELPKTLKGLAELGKKLGVDISKITLQEVQPDTQAKKVEAKIAEIPLIIAKKESTAPQPLANKISQESLRAALNFEIPHAKIASKETAKEIAVPKLAEEIPHAKIATKEAAKETAKEAATPEVLQAINTKVSKMPSIADTTHTQIIKDKIQEQTEPDIQKVALPQEVKATPLVKAQEQKVYSTQLLVQMKQLKDENQTGANNKVQMTSKSKTDETLTSLLRGEKPIVANPVISPDLSFTPATTLTPTTSSDSSTATITAMEKLLYGETQPQNETSTNVKTDIFTVNKSEELEVKMNEAKQMVRYLSSDVKGAIEDYKSPFTRVKVQLNPQKLGEVELTIVQRGNNLHVNISSNNAAINTLALNANELRTTLTNNGINNATLNFNNTSDNSSFSQQQQNRQNEKQAHKEYNYYEKEEVKEEILSSLEIIVPRYI